MTAYLLSDVVSIDNVVQVTGSVTVQGVELSASFPASMTVAQGAGSSTNPWWFTTTGSLPIVGTVTAVAPVSNTGNVSVLTASFVSSPVLNANANRLSALFTNDDSSVGNVYLKLGSGASTGSYSVKLRPGAYYEATYHYVGLITGIWDALTGTLYVTELTP